MKIEFTHPTFLEISQHIVCEFNKEKNEAFFLAGADKNTSHLHEFSCLKHDFKTLFPWIVSLKN